MTLFAAGLASIGLGIAVAALFTGRARAHAVATLGVLGCALSFLAATSVLRSGRATSFHTTQILPLSGVRFTLDPLGALFVAMVSALGVAVFIYNLGYARHEMSSRTAQILLLVFVASLLSVPAASNVATFMFLWESMALSSMLLILIEQRRNPDARRAAQWYAVMTQLGAASIFFGLLILSLRGGQSFGDIKTHLASISPALRSIAFLATLIGFSSKAGAVPFHVWLPRAHPEAPSPVSALMSGAMVAMGIYGVLRVGGDLLGGGTLWWWLVVTALGALSAFYGALHATTSTDLKRLLAYSTIDMLGLVLVGVGCAGALRATGQPGAAQLALSGALLLLLSHAAFKGGLFLGAGAIERATGTRDLDRLGGLTHRLPVTSLFFGVAALSIMAVPALSGFASEWLILQGMLHGFVSTSTAALIGLLTGVTVLALTGGLTAVAFVKVLGVGLLGQARSPGAASAREVPLTMQVAMGLLVIPSLVLGVVPGWVMPMLHRAVNVVEPSSSHALKSGTGLALSRLHGAIEPLLLLSGFLGVVVVIWIVRSLWQHSSPRRVAAWRGGGEAPTARMQYTATSFGEPLQRVFADVLRPEIDVEVTHEVESSYYEQAISYESRVNDVFERHGYLPVIAFVTLLGRRARRLQNGSVHRYLAFGFVALLVALIVLA